MRRLLNGLSLIAVAIWVVTVCVAIAGDLISIFAAHQRPRINHHVWSYSSPALSNWVRTGFDIQTIAGPLFLLETLPVLGCVTVLVVLHGQRPRRGILLVASVLSLLVLLWFGRGLTGSEIASPGDFPYGRVVVDVAVVFLALATLAWALLLTGKERWARHPPAGRS